MKKGKCAKCKTYTVVEKHHILPKNIFGLGETIFLCPTTCHSIYHYEILGTKNVKNPDAEFHKRTLYLWLQMIVALFVAIGLIYYYFSYFQNITNANAQKTTKTEMSAHQ